MRKLLIMTIFCAVALTAAAQKIVSVSGDYTYYAPSTLTLEEAKRTAILETRKHVLEAKFGTMINSTTHLHIGNTESSEGVKSRTNVETFSKHEVKGEWIEDTRPAEQEISYDPSLPNTTIIKTRIWGRAREITEPKIDLAVKILKDTLSAAEADVFSNQQEFYLYFQAPTNGYLVVYLEDDYDEMAYRLLPASIDGRGAVEIKGNQEYIFFSEGYAKKHYDETNQSVGTSYMFTTEQSISYNNFYVLFSPNQFFKANDSTVENDHYTLPPATDINNFRKWLVDCKIRDTQLVEKSISVKIVK